MNTLMVGLDLNPPWVEGIRNSVREHPPAVAKEGTAGFFLGFLGVKKVI